MYLKTIIPVMALLILTLAITGALEYFDLMSGRLFYYIHPFSGFVLFGLVVLHVGLNWGWIRAQYGGRRPVAKVGPQTGEDGGEQDRRAA
jgi:hypothetical protein